MRTLGNQLSILNTSATKNRLESRSKMVRTRGYTWQRIRYKTLLRDKYTCQSCGRVGGALEIDHILPICRGGTDTPSNLQTLCVTCHREKSINDN